MGVDFSLSNVFILIWGAFWLFQGLNGIFHWVPVPFVSDKMNKAVEAFYQIPGFMTSVKLFQVLAGVLCLFPQLHIASWLLLAPILFGINLLHFNFNPKPWGLLLFLNLPWAAVGLLIFFN